MKTLKPLVFCSLPCFTNRDTFYSEGPILPFPARTACAHLDAPPLLLRAPGAPCSAVCVRVPARCSARCRGSSGFSRNEAVGRVSPDGPREPFFFPAGDAVRRVAANFGLRWGFSSFFFFFVRSAKGALKSAGECPSLRTYATGTCPAPQVGHRRGYR